MTKSLALLVVLLAAGCANAQQSGAELEPSQPSAPGGKTACRLPIGIGGTTAPLVTPGPRLSGFVAYPDGSFTPDPSSDPTQSAYPGPNFWVIGVPGVPSYDWPARRWLPVPTVLVSPDGATYVYSELVSPPAPAASGSRPGPGPVSDTRIHIVDVASTADHVILDTRSGWATVGYTGKDVYLIHGQPEAAPDSDLYALDVSTLAMRELSAPLPAGSEASPIAWKLIGTDAAWGSDLDGRLFRLDFLTRTVSLWLSVPGKIREPIALDAQGRPIVSGDPFGAWLVNAPQQVVQIADESTWVDDARADAHGIWLLTDQGVYLWAHGAAPTLVSAAVTQNGPSRRLAGPCQ